MGSVGRKRSIEITKRFKKWAAARGYKTTERAVGGISAERYRTPVTRTTKSIAVSPQVPKAEPIPTPTRAEPVAIEPERISIGIPQGTVPAERLLPQYELMIRQKGVETITKRTAVKETITERPILEMVYEKKKKQPVFGIGLSAGTREVIYTLAPALKPEPIGGETPMEIYPEAVRETGKGVIKGVPLLVPSIVDIGVEVVKKSPIIAAGIVGGVKSFAKDPFGTMKKTGVIVAGGLSAIPVTLQETFKPKRVTPTEMKEIRMKASEYAHLGGEVVGAGAGAYAIGQAMKGVALASSKGLATSKIVAKQKDVVMLTGKGVYETKIPFGAKAQTFAKYEAMIETYPKGSVMWSGKAKDYLKVSGGIFEKGIATSFVQKPRVFGLLGKKRAIVQQQFAGAGLMETPVKNIFAQTMAGVTVTKGKPEHWLAAGIGRELLTTPEKQIFGSYTLFGKTRLTGGLREVHAISIAPSQRVPFIGQAAVTGIQTAPPSFAGFEHLRIARLLPAPMFPPAIVPSRSPPKIKEKLFPETKIKIGTLFQQEPRAKELVSLKPTAITETRPKFATGTRKAVQIAIPQIQLGLAPAVKPKAAPKVAVTTRAVTFPFMFTPSKVPLVPLPSAPFFPTIRGKFKPIFDFGIRDRQPKRYQPSLLGIEKGLITPAPIKGLTGLEIRPMVRKKKKKKKR